MIIDNTDTGKDDDQANANPPNADVENEITDEELSEIAAGADVRISSSEFKTTLNTADGSLDGIDRIKTTLNTVGGSLDGINRIKK